MNYLDRPKVANLCFGKCPYLASVSDRSKICTITCEGIIAPAETIHKFKSQHDRDYYFETYCSEFPNNCEWFKTLEKSYKEGKR